MGAISLLLRSSPGKTAGVGLLVFLLLIQHSLDLFAHIHGDFQYFALAVDGEQNLLAYGCLPHKADQFGTGHCFSVHRGDHIPFLQPGLGSGTIFRNRLHGCTGRNTISLGFSRNIQNADANIRFGNISLFNDGLHDIQNGIDGNGKADIVNGGTAGSIAILGVGDQLSAGKTLMVLSDVGYSATYRQLTSTRQEYEELMLQLFQMYQTETVTAPCDGVVSGIDKDSVQLLSANGQDYIISFLANAPNGDNETLYANYAGQVTSISPEGWGLNIDPQAIPIDDYMVLSGVSLDTAAMTQPVIHTQTTIPVYTLSEGTWVQIENSTICVGDILLFAADGNGSLVWGVLLQKAPQAEQPEDPTQPGDTTEPGDPSGSGTPGFTYPSGGYPSGGSWGGAGGMVEQEPAFELYGLDMAQIAAVTPQDTMTLDITIDELDISALQVGMSAQVKIDALGGEKYTATITEIGNTGTSNGGNSKYTVELTMDRAGNMLDRMNATATIVLSTTSEVLTIPADALVETGNQTVVYTGYDEERDTLLNPVAVTVGNSDGETVEILEGLANGQTYYYAYYDTLEISFAPDFGVGGFMFG